MFKFNFKFNKDLSDKIVDYTDKFQALIIGIVVTLGLIITAHVIVGALPSDGITVTGSASKIVQSDTAELDLDIMAKDKSKKMALTILKKQTPIVIAYLKANGIEDKDIDIKVINSYNTFKVLPNGNTSNEIAYYNLDQPISVKSNDIQKIKKISVDISNLMDKGIDIDVKDTEYFYSKISDLKVELLNEATKDAKQRASAMLKATHNRTGKIQSVKMGVFQITDANSTDVSDGGIYDTSSIEKKVTAVANVVFKIK